MPSSALTPSHPRSPAEASAPPEPGLRERKKEATRRALADAALTLFAEHGFEQTTVEDIVAVVEVAPRTFHRYFARKEDVLYLDAEQHIAALRHELTLRPTSEPKLTSMREAVKIAMHDVAEHHDREVLRSRVLADNPIIKAANLRYLAAWAAVFTEFIGTRRGGTRPDDPWPAVVAQCVVGAVSVARSTWLDRGGDLDARIDESFVMLGRLGELARTTPPEAQR